MKSSWRGRGFENHVFFTMAAPRRANAISIGFPSGTTSLHRRRGNTSEILFPWQPNVAYYSGKCRTKLSHGLLNYGEISEQNGMSPTLEHPLSVMSHMYISEKR